MQQYTTMLEDTIWCSDKSIDSKSDTVWKYGTWGRNLNNILPSIKCPNASDKYSVNSITGNGRLVYPIGLLTGDKVTLAGHGNKGYTTLGYLCNNENFWLLSPNFSNTYYSDVLRVSTEGNLLGACVREVYGVRPSISLINSTIVKEGNGSFSNPYKLIEENT